MASDYPSKITDILILPLAVEGITSPVNDVLKDIVLFDLLSTWTEPEKSSGLDTGGDELTEDDWNNQLEPISIDDFTGDGNVTADSRSVLSGLTPVIGTTKLTLSVELLSEVTIDVPWFNGISFVISTGAFEIIATLLEDKFEIGFLSEMVIRLSKEILRPMKTNQSGITWIDDESRDHTDVTVSQADISFNSSGTIAVETDSKIYLSEPVEIGNTGIIVEFADIEFNLNGAGAKPEGTIDDWKGLLINNAIIRIPELFEGSFEATGLGLGSSGISGTIEVTFNDELKGTILGIADGRIKSIDLTFQENIPTSTSIKAEIELPFFDSDELVDIEISISIDGDFLISIDTSDGIKSIETTYFVLKLMSLSIGKSDDKFYIELSGTLLINEVLGVQLPEISIDNVRIYSDGSVTVEGGSITLEQQQIIDLYGFQMEIDSVGFGSEEERNYVSFSGGVKLTDALPVGVSATGLRYWLDDHTITLDGVGISFEIPGTLSFSGNVDLDTDDGQFSGDILLKLLPIDLSVNARIIIGEETDDGSKTFKFFYIELDVGLPLGVPLGATGLALFGFSGKVANNMEPTRTDDDDFNWYEDWHLVGEPWNPKYSGFGMGVGTTVGTIFDNGFTCSTKISFMIVFPGPVIMLQGVGNLLRKRSALPDNYLFDSLIVFDGNAKNLLAVLEMNYLLPNGTSNEGLILDASGTAEGFFDFNDFGNWHIYLGEEEESKRIKAEILDHIFKAESYLMLDPDWLRAGAYIGFDKKYEFKVAKVYFSAWIYGSAGISWAPSHLEGELGFEGEVGLSVCNIEFGVSVNASVGGEIPTPQKFYVDYTIEVKLPSPLKDLEIDGKISWENAEEPEPVTGIIQEAHIREQKTTSSFSLSLLSDANDNNDKDEYYPKDEYGEEILVPIDSRPVLIFDRNLWDENNYGTPSPVQGYEETGDTYFSYKLEVMKLQKWDGEKWGDEIEINGSWQATGEKEGTELEIKGDGPFSFTKETITSSSEEIVESSIPSYVDSFLSNHVLSQFPPLLNDMEGISFVEYSSYTNLGRTTEKEGVKFYGYSGLKASYLVLSNFYYQSQDLFGIELTSEKLLHNEELNSTNRIRIEFSEPAYIYVILLYTVQGCKYKGLITMADGSTISVPLSTAGDGLISLYLKYGNVKSVELTIVENTCYLFFVMYSYEYYRLSQEATRICSESRYIFEVDSAYRISIGTNTYRNGETEPESSETKYAFFRTSGPPEDLSQYIDKVVFSNNGNPHYCLYDMKIYFNENYVNSMYNGLLETQVYDQNGECLTDSTETTTGKGEVSHSYYIDVWYKSIKEVIAEIDCEGEEAADDFVLGKLITPLPERQLLELHLEYEGRKLWSVPFITSSYYDFQSLINDFTKQPWYETLPDGSSLNITDGDEYENVYYEKLLLASRNLPEHPEFTLIKDTTGDIRIILISLPEPIDWERVKDTLLIEELKKLSDGTYETKSKVDYKVFSRKDNCSFLLCIQGSSSVKIWPSGSYRFTFEYDLKKEGLPELSKSKTSFVLGEEVTKESASVIIEF